MKRKLKRRVKKVRRRVKRQAKYYTQMYFWRTIYLAGLAAVIPAVVINAAPTELGFLSGAPFPIMATALALILVGIGGIVKMHNTKREAFMALAWTTLFPGIIAVGISLGLRPMVTSIVNEFSIDISKIDPLIDLYLERAIPQVGFLILGFISVGGLWYMLAKAVE